MKKLVLLLAVILTFSMVMPATAASGTATGAEESVLRFQQDYCHLLVSSYTDDRARIAMDPYPDGGTVVMIQIITEYGTNEIDIREVEKNSGSYRLEISGRIRSLYCLPFDCRVRGVSFMNGLNKLDRYQNELEILFLVPDDGIGCDTRLRISDFNSGRDRVVALPPINSILDVKSSKTVEPITGVEGMAENMPILNYGTFTTLPDKVQMSFNQAVGQMRVAKLGMDMQQRLTVTVSSYGKDVIVEDGEITPFLEATAVVNSQEYDWKRLGFKDGNIVYGFDTDQAPDIVYLYPTGNRKDQVAFTVTDITAADASTLGFISVLSKSDLPDASAATNVAEPAAVTDAQKQKAAQAIESFRRVRFIRDLIAAQAEKTKDPWFAAILQKGVKDVSLTGDTLSFRMRSYNPLSQLSESSAGDAIARLYASVAAYDLLCTLKVSEVDGDFTATDGDVKALFSDIAKAAAVSKKAYGSREVCDALMAELASTDLTACSYDEFTPLFATVKSPKITATDGPHALKFSGAFPDFTAMAKKAYDAGYEQVLALSGTEALKNTDATQLIMEQLTAQTDAMRKKASVKWSFVFDIDTLHNGTLVSDCDAYYNFVYGYRDALSERSIALTDLITNVWDYPVVEMPKTGRLSGSTTGTKVILKIPDDGLARYVQMRNADTDAVAVAAFIQPKKSTSVRVPKGMYYLMVGMGELWFGEQHLFGDSGSYLRTEQIEILGSNYYHTITLGGVTDGNMSSYDANPGEFQ